MFGSLSSRDLAGGPFDSSQSSMEVHEEPYVPPRSVEWIEALVSFRQETSIVAVINGTPRQQLDGTTTSAQVEYVQGLVGIGAFMFGLLLVWLIVLLLLKWAGNRVGCASGRPFPPWSLPTTEESPRRNQKVDSNNAAGLWRSFSNPQEDNGDNNDDDKDDPAFDDFDEDLTFDDELPPAFVYSSAKSTTTFKSKLHNFGAGCCSSDRNQMETRKSRTAWVYTICFLMVQTTGILLFIYFIYPLLNETTEAQVMVVDGQEIHSSVTKSLHLLQESLKAVEKVLAKIPLDLDKVCSNMTQDDLTSRLGGTEFVDMLDFLDSGYDSIAESARESLDAATYTAESMNVVLANSTETLEYAEKSLWAMPALVLSNMMVLWIFAMLLAMKSFRRAAGIIEISVLYDDVYSLPPPPPNKNRASRRSLGKFVLQWILLPLSLLLACCTFATATTLLIGSVVGADTCTAGTAQSPDAVIEAVIERYELLGDLEELSADNLRAYTSRGCDFLDPVENVKTTARIMDQVSGLLHQWIQKAPAEYGIHTTLNQDCGSGNQLQKFFDGVFLLNNQLWTIQLALNDLGEVLSCPSVHAMYTAAVHELACTQVASHAVWGFFLMLLHALSSLILFSLRAVWQ